MSPHTPASLDRSPSDSDSLMEMQRIYEANVAELPLSGRPPSQRTPDRHTVLITGSTGSLGNYMLDWLLRDEGIDTIYCFNRSPDSERRQRRTMAERGLSQEFALKNTTFLQGDLSKPYLGLSSLQYLTLLRAVTLIIHNAWAVDFNQPLAQMASLHLQGVTRLTDFSSRSTYSPLIFFISSIGAAMRFQPSPSQKKDNLAAIPEQIFHDPRIPQQSGYARSKHLAERVLDTAARLAGIPSAICRVGQIAGPTTKQGMWPRSEWFPRILASSKILGKLPDIHLAGTPGIDWVPVGAVAQIVVQLAKHAAALYPPGDWSRGEISPPVYHVVNPHKTPWRDILPAVAARMGGLEIVRPEEWMRVLRQSSGWTVDVAEAKKNAALRLVDFLEEVL
ncbi:MAG: hypothetical protein LQ340_006619, partial [Diploschistes diacapsis]